MDEAQAGDADHFGKSVSGMVLSGVLPKAAQQALTQETMLQAAKGLKEMHDTGLLHNDLKAPNFLIDEDGTVKVSASLETGSPGLFAGGDMVPSERTVTVGVGHGKKAARHIDAWLRNQKSPSVAKHELAAFERLHLWYFGDNARRLQPELAPEERVADFNEVVGGLSAEEAVYEAGRCLSCGNCFECDGCLGSCPEDAVIKLGVGNRYRFNYDRCTGCGACFEQCPVHAIEMVAEAN